MFFGWKRLNSLKTKMITGTCELNKNWCETSYRSKIALLSRSVHLPFQCRNYWRTASACSWRPSALSPTSIPASYNMWMEFVVLVRAYVRLTRIAESGSTRWLSRTPCTCRYHNTSAKRTRLYTVSQKTTPTSHNFVIMLNRFPTFSQAHSPLN